jgi:acyl-CoA reductase-like NAD-dependent aldehyde dehydrogenase
VISPLINAAAVQRVTREVNEAVEAGAKVLAGGRADGSCYQPTILADVPAGARIHSEETFGPVVVAQAADSDAGAVHVNDQTVAAEPQLPLGGVKDSGWGRSGPASMSDFTELQWITTREGTGAFPI